MENHAINAETRYDDLNGAISVNFRNDENFSAFAARMARVDPQKYQPISMRVYIDREAILTIYALDRERSPLHKQQTGKLLVRKFKVDITLEELFTHFRQMDFTLISSGYDVADFEVIN